MPTSHDVVLEALACEFLAETTIARPAKRKIHVCGPSIDDMKSDLQALRSHVARLQRKSHRRSSTSDSHKIDEIREQSEDDDMESQLHSLKRSRSTQQSLRTQEDMDMAINRLFGTHYSLFDVSPTMHQVNKTVLPVPFRFVGAAAWTLFRDLPRPLWPEYSVKARNHLDPSTSYIQAEGEASSSRLFACKRFLDMSREVIASGLIDDSSGEPHLRHSSWLMIEPFAMDSLQTCVSFAVHDLDESEDVMQVLMDRISIQDGASTTPTWRQEQSLTWKNLKLRTQNFMAALEKAVGHCGLSLEA
ncbi:hypothetical protein LEN26_016437 [Aphanomyces euteiches]|nr:hypothetical protein LEN26_016437 [Aphanomyces euteiches]